MLVLKTAAAWLCCRQNGLVLPARGGDERKREERKGEKGREEKRCDRRRGEEERARKERRKGRRAATVWLRWS